MEVTVRGIPQNLRVSTITLQPQGDNTLYAFHCSHCGNFHQQVMGEISKNYPFYEPSNDVASISTCRNCGHKYTFQTFDGYSSQKTRVVLHAQDTTNYFYCSYGKHRILEFSPDRVVTTGDGRKHGFPFQANCPDGECKRAYWFAEIL